MSYADAEWMLRQITEPDRLIWIKAPKEPLKLFSGIVDRPFKGLRAAGISFELLLVINRWDLPCVQPCPGDYVYDNVVNNADLNFWGPCECLWCPDGNQDDVVNTAALLIVNNNRGSCP